LKKEKARRRKRAFFDLGPKSVAAVNLALLLSYIDNFREEL